MKRNAKLLMLGASLPLLALADLSPDAPLGLGLAREAAAVVGAPLTPMSYAGVARRTTRRVVAVEATAATTATASAAAAAGAQQQAIAQQQAATAQQQAAVAQQQAAVAQQQAQAAQPKPAAAPAIGTVVPALPGGCKPTPVGGVEYYLCGDVWYRSAFQGNNLVYVVQPKP